MTEDKPTAFLLYDGPIGNPWSTERELRAEIQKLEDWLGDPKAFTPSGRKQVERIVARGKEQLALGEFRAGPE